MFEAVFLIIVGFILLIKGADFLVDGASGIAKKFHISELIIGLTIVSIGTTMPELIVSTTSALGGHSDIAIGNVIGSCLTNLLLILGLTATINSIQLNKQTKIIDIPLFLFVIFVFCLLSNVGQNITKIEGAFLIILFMCFILYTVLIAKKHSEENKKNEVEEKNNKNSKLYIFKNIIYIIIGIIILKIGGDFTVNSSIEIAKYFGLSEKIIGVTIVAIGTSLPELFTALTAANKKSYDIAIGNVLGANILNILLIVGVSSAITPIIYNLSYNKDLIILIVSTLILLIFSYIPPKNQMSRMNGIVYLLIYIIYMITLFV